MGPSAVLDKSALEALNVDESVWLEAFVDALVVPVFYVEVLADLEKRGRQGQSPETGVARLAAKTPSNAYPNVHHRTMLLNELAGGTISMTHRPVIQGGAVRRDRDGRIGLHVDEFPEQTALQRWQRHEFEAVERLVAKNWRAELAEQDLEPMVERAKSVLPADRKLSDLQQLKVFVDEYVASRSWKPIAFALSMLGISDKEARAIRKRWERNFRRPLDRFAPYTAHVFKVDLLFYLGIARGFISGERASNKADIAYLYYLPFAAAFVSGDGLHRRTAPLFMDDSQAFIDAKELKRALREFDEHYDALPQQIKDRGVMAFASYPPSTIDNVVTRSWDTSMRKDWREVAAMREADIDEPFDLNAGKATVDELNTRMAEAEPVPPGIADQVAADPDYFFLTRNVPAKKGKWRIVSEEVEAAGNES
jgi:hypothetical protein